MIIKNDSPYRKYQKLAYCKGDHPYLNHSLKGGEVPLTPSHLGFSLMEARVECPPLEF